MKIKQFLLAAYIIIGSISSLSANPMFGRSGLFVNDWKFKLLNSQEEEEDLLSHHDFSEWRSVTLPHDWSVEGPYSPHKSSATGYLPGGLGWYAKEFEIPDEEKENKIYIYFEGVYNRSKVYINNQLVGERPNGYMSFLCDLTPYIKFGEKNQLKVSVDHRLDNDSRWYTGSGIYRDVYLVYANPTHVDLWGTYVQTHNVSAKKADVVVNTTLRNHSQSRSDVKLELSLVNKQDGKVVATTTQHIKLTSGDSTTITRKMVVNNPLLWSIKSPNLYILTTKVYINGKLTENNSQHVGIRTLTFDANKGFALNGEWMKLKGVCIHHDAGCLGSAVPKEVWNRRLMNLKAIGCNAIRLSHNPHAPALYEVCDEIGLVVIDEAFDEWEYPKKKWIYGWNVGIPGYQGNADFFHEWGERDLQDMVLRDRNHPSVIMWSIGNEVDYPNDPYTHPVLDHAAINQPVQGGFLPDNPGAERLSEISKRLADVVRRLDSTRPVTAGLAGVIMSNYTEYPFNLDVCGYNYTEDRYEMDHEAYPDRIIYGSENGHSLDAWKAVVNNENIFGQFIWTGTDYLGESGPWPSRGFYTGLLDFGSFPKPRGYFRRVMWSEEPVAYIGTYPAKYARKHRWLSQDAWPIWNYESGDSIRVVSYTNTPQARLLLNGTVAGELKSFNEETFITSWDIPYSPGELTVEGMDMEGNVICNYTIRSSERPHIIKAESDKDIISSERGVAQIIIEILDENGVPVFFADNEVTCHLDGPVRLLGLESSKNDDMGDYTDNRQRVFHGRMIAYVQATGEQGKATVHFTSPWLQAGKVSLEVK